VKAAGYVRISQLDTDSTLPSASFAAAATWPTELLIGTMVSDRLAKLGREVLSTGLGVAGVTVHLGRL
jgi:hypothetical protein